MQLAQEVCVCCTVARCVCCTVAQCLATAVILVTCFSKLSSLTSTFQVSSKTEVLHVASPGFDHTSYALQLLLVMTFGHWVLTHCKLQAVQACLDLMVPSTP